MVFKVNKYFWWYNIVCLFGTRIYFRFKKQCVTNVFDRFSLVNLLTWCMTNLEVIEVCGPRVFWSRNTREYLTTVGSQYNDFFGHSKIRFPGWPIFKLQYKRFTIRYVGISRLTSNQHGFLRRMRSFQDYSCYSIV